MTKPLALVFYENLLPGTQIVNRLQDLGYRVQTIPRASLIQQHAEKEGPLVLLAEVSHQNDTCAEIAKLKASSTTKHLPVLAYSARENEELRAAAQKAGANLLANSMAILEQLPQLLDRVLELD